MIPSAGHLFYVTDLDAPELNARDQHHAARVLRLRGGEELSVADGAGRWRRCCWTGTAAEPIGPIHREPQPAEPLTVAFALLKGSKPELVVQKLTELGIDRIVPLRVERAVVRHDAGRAERFHERLGEIAREAGMQSRRARLPLVGPTVSFREFLTSEDRPLLADRGGRPLRAGDTCVVIGPEGGWSDAERRDVPADDVVALAPGVLRAETAAMAAGVLLASLRSAHDG